MKYDRLSIEERMDGYEQRLKQLEGDHFLKTLDLEEMRALSDIVKGEDRVASKKQIEDLEVMVGYTECRIAAVKLLLANVQSEKLLGVVDS
jgi:hypothetical protein